MQAAAQAEWISVEDYLESEKSSQIRHKYIGGALHAMAGASDEQIALCINLVSALRNHLQGKPSRVQINEGKVRLRIGDEDIFYCPDLMVVCDPRDKDRYFKRFPKVVIEVLSQSTEAIDRREKFLSYRQIETLEEYVLVAQDRIEITVFRRENHWQPEVLLKPEQQFRLKSLDFHFPLQKVYEGVNI